MDLWDSFWSALTGFISENGLLGVAVIVLLRSAAIPIPVPADLLVVTVGARAREQEASLWQAWIVLSAATTIGAFLFYGFVRWVGEGDTLVRYGRYVGLSGQRLNTAEARLGQRGVRSIYVARMVPGLRLAVVAVCGMMRFRWWMFIVAVALGALTYVGLCLTIGYVFGSAILGLLGRLVFPAGLLEPLIGLAILSLWLRRARRASAHSVSEVPLPRATRVRLGALTGALAITGASMLVNALTYVIAPVAAAFAEGTRGVDTVIRSSGGLDSVLQGLLGSLLVGIVGGAVYALEDRRRFAEWRDWLRGIAFGALLFVVVVLVQWLAISQRDGLATTWQVRGSVELVRTLACGAFIGLIYPVFRVRRAVG